MHQHQQGKISTWDRPAVTPIEDRTGIAAYLPTLYPRILSHIPYPEGILSQPNVVIEIVVLLKTLN